MVCVWGGGVVGREMVVRILDTIFLLLLLFCVVVVARMRYHFSPLTGLFSVQAQGRYSQALAEVMK